MDQILITRANGTVELLNSSSTVSVVTKAEQRKAFLGEDVVVITVESAEDRGFGIGDKIKLFGLYTYKINQIPRLERKSERKIVCDLTFEGLQYDLIRAVYRNEDVSSFNTTSNFTLVGDIEMYLNVLINNANRVFGSGKWELGDFPANTDTKNLLFNGENCLAVLQRICTEYGYGFVIEETSTNNILHVRKVGVNLGFSFEYGRGKGLYSLSRQKVDSKNIVNTLYVYGSDKNIPYGYKNFSERLRLGLAMAEPVLMANDSISAFGTFEGVVVFDEIFPNREASVTGISSGNKFEFTDSTMFDLNELDGEGNTKYLIPGNNAKIHFNSGNLSGYEFEVEKYVHSTRTFTIKQNIDPKGLNMPSITEEAFQIQIGDKYVIIDIAMPSSYITAAEAKLEAKAEEFLLANKFPTVQYSLLIDETYLTSKGVSNNVFDIGNTVQVKDSEMLIDSRIKINGFTRDVLFPYRYQLTLSESTESNILLRLSRDTKSISSLLKEKKIVDVTRQKQDSTINTQIVSRIDSELNKRPVVKVGQSAENLELGNPANDSLVKVLGRLGIANQSNFLGEISAVDLTANRVAKLPDRDIEINKWSDLSGVPDFESNFVTIDTDQTITGGKKFTSNRTEVNQLFLRNIATPSAIFSANAYINAYVLSTNVAHVKVQKDATNFYPLNFEASAYSFLRGNINYVGQLKPQSLPGINGNVLRTNGTSDSWGFVDWAELTGKPSTFAPSAHFHSISNITGLESALEGKQAASANLASLAALSANGIVRKTGTNTFGVGTNDPITLSGDVSGTGTTAIAVTLANSGVAAGTYRSVTVDAKGRVTAGSVPNYNVEWDTRWNTKINDYVEFGSDVFVAGGSLGIANNLFLGGNFFDKDSSIGLANQVLMPVTGGGIAWTNLSISQISDFSENVLSQVLTGFGTGSNVPLNASNTILTAFQNLQTQINSQAQVFDGYWKIGGNVGVTGDMVFDIVSAYDGEVQQQPYDYLWKINGFEKMKLTPQGNLGVGGIEPEAVIHAHAAVDGNAEVIALKATNQTSESFFSIGIDSNNNQTNLYAGGEVWATTISKFKFGVADVSGLWTYSIIPQTTADATLGNELVRLSQVQSLLAGGFSISTSCALVFVTNQGLSGAKTQDDYTTVLFDKILLTAQSAPSENGVYHFDGTNWIRNEKNDSDAEIRGKGHLIKFGTYANSQWVNNNASTITVGTTAITYAQWSGSELDPVWDAFKTANDITETRIGNWNTAFGWGNHANLYVDKTSNQNNIAGAKVFTASIQSPIVKAGTDALNITMSNISGTAPRIASNSTLDFAATTKFDWLTSGNLGRMRLTGSGLRIGSTSDPLYTLHAVGTIGFEGLISLGRTAHNISMSSGTVGQYMRRSLVYNGFYNVDVNNWANITVADISDISTAYQAKITGTENYVIKKTASNVGTSQIFDDGTNVVIGGTAAINSSKFSVVGQIGATTAFFGSGTSGITVSSDGLSSTLATNYNATTHIFKIANTTKLTLDSTKLALVGHLDLTGRIKLNGTQATANQVLTSDGTNDVWSLIGVQSIADIATYYQGKLNGMGFVKMNGGTLSYEQFSEFGRYLNSSNNVNVTDAPIGHSYVAGLATGLPNELYQGHSFKLPTGADRPNHHTYFAFGLPDQTFDNKIYARGVYGSVDTGWKAIGGDIADYRVYSAYNDSEIDLRGYYYEFTPNDKAIFVGIDKTNGTYDIQVRSANNNDNTVNDYRNFIDTDGRWYFQNGTNVAQKYLLDGEVAGGGSGTNYTVASPLYFVGNEINVSVASASQAGVLTAAKFTEFDGKLADGGTINSFLNFDNSPLYFGRIGTSNQAIGTIKAQNWNAGADSDFVITSFGIDSDIVLVPTATMIVRSESFASNTAVQGIEVDLGENHINSVLKLNGTKLNFKRPSSLVNGQRLVFQYNATTDTIYLVTE